MGPRELPSFASPSWVGGFDEELESLGPRLSHATVTQGISPERLVGRIQQPDGIGEAPLYDGSRVVSCWPVVGSE